MFTNLKNTVGSFMASDQTKAALELGAMLVGFIVVVTIVNVGVRELDGAVTKALHPTK